MITRIVHVKKEKYEVYIGRPSKWGNPFSHQGGTLAAHKVETREEAIKEYEDWVRAGGGNILRDIEELRDKILGLLVRSEALPRRRID